MNKELIKKYKVEFDYYLNGGSLLCLDTNLNWYSPSSNNLFNFDNPEKIKSIVMIDEYIEYRKALAEGKQIEYYSKALNKWNDTSIGNPNRQFKENYTYRVKPDEPKKDWRDAFRYLGEPVECACADAIKLNHTGICVSTRILMAYVLQFKHGGFWYDNCGLYFITAGLHSDNKATYADAMEFVENYKG